VFATSISINDQSPYQYSINLVAMRPFAAPLVHIADVGVQKRCERPDKERSVEFGDCQPLLGRIIAQLQRSVWKKPSRQTDPGVSLSIHGVGGCCGIERPLIMQTSTRCTWRRPTCS